VAKQFVSNSTVTYDVGLDGTTTVTHDITLQNKTTDFYATSYTLGLTGISPINPVAQENSTSLPIKVTSKNGTSSLQVDFPDAVVGMDGKREFSISFIDKTLVRKIGEIWEITTPKLADSNSFDFYSTILKIPNSFGQLAYISPTPSFKDNKNGKMIFSFDKNANLTSTVTAAFGQFQVFSFNLTYHLENPLSSFATTEIALPPDTNYQKVNYTKISPAPSKVFIDQDGNWIASFNLKAREQIDVKAIGAVQLFADPVNLPKSLPTPNDLAQTDLWQTNAPQIEELAKQYKTPKAIYDYVTSNLSYDYAKVAPNVQRLGALGALKTPKSVICTEFTDLFVAIARAAHIPTREIEGFAYTDNPQIQPLSLVADVLHAWPEYWDNAKQIWIPIDPTWGSTSQIDYFNKLDLKHFAFVIHGVNSTKPYPAGSYKLGANPQKDVNVTFGSLPQNRASNLQIKTKVLTQFPFSDEILDVKVINPGPVAVYNLNYSADQQITIDAIAPYGYFETNIKVPYSFLGQTTPEKVEILIDGIKKSEITTYKTFLTISNLLMLSLFVFFIVTLVYLKFRDGKTKKSA
jgi:transglutaminase-like putative cysteine protease